MKLSRMTVKGQITLPKEMRERFRLRPGEPVALESEGDGIKVRPLGRTILDWAGTLRATERGLSDRAIRSRVRKMRLSQRLRGPSHG